MDVLVKKVEGAFPLVFSKLVVSSSGNDHTDSAERDDEDRADVLATRYTLGEIASEEIPL